VDTRQKKMPKNQELFKKFARWAKSHGLETRMGTTLAESSGWLGEEAHDSRFLTHKGL